MTPVLTTRRYATGEHGTFSKATLTAKSGEDVWHGYVLEDDWKDNAPQESCIPAGRYQAFFRTPENTPATVKKMGVYELRNVPERSGILVHGGRTEEWTQGCLLIGTMVTHATVRVDEDTGARNVVKGAIEGSADALEGLHRATGKADILVVIDWESGVGERNDA